MNILLSSTTPSAPDLRGGRAPRVCTCDHELDSSTIHNEHRSTTSHSHNTHAHVIARLTDVKLEQILLAASAISAPKDVHAAICPQQQFRYKMSLCAITDDPLTSERFAYVAYRYS